MYSSIALKIQENAKECPDKIAFIVNDETCDYASLAKYNRKVANFLSQNGIKPEDRVIVESDHTLPYIYVWYGIQLLGAVFVPLEKNTPSNRIIEISKFISRKIFNG